MYGFAVKYQINRNFEDGQDPKANNAQMSPESLIEGIRLNNYASVQFHVEHGINIPLDAVETAFLRRSYDIVKFLINNKAQITDNALAYACYQNKFDMVKLLVNNQAKLYDGLIYDAVDSHNLELIQWLVEKGAKISKAATIGAVFYEDYNIAEYLLKNCGRITDKEISDAKQSYSYGKWHRVEEWLNAHKNKPDIKAMVEDPNTRFEQLSKNCQEEYLNYQQNNYQSVSNVDIVQDYHLINNVSATNTTLVEAAE